VYGTSRNSVIHQLFSAAYAVDGGTGDALAILKDLETTSVDSSPHISCVNMENLCYNIQWKPDIDLIEPSNLGGFCQDGSDLKQFYSKISLLLAHFSLLIRSKFDISCLDKSRPPRHISFNISSGWKRKL
jgi:hypothetical protein